AGASYECRDARAITAMAERERAAVVTAATRLRAAGFAAPIVSVGSTPTALFAERLDGVTEVRAGVYVFMDLVMVGLGVCTLDDVALSVAVTVIGHQRQKHWLLTDGGWMALSRDRGTAAQPVDRGYGLVGDERGQPLDELIVTGTNQEHGIVARADGAPFDLDRFPVGTVLRVLPNHACATAAQHDRYHVVRGDDVVTSTLPRFGGW
ncbi:MAG: DSD1 family PLP-dependent enzyme, partial [Planctomycetota bacterium]